MEKKSIDDHLQKLEDEKKFTLGGDAKANPQLMERKDVYATKFGFVGSQPPPTLYDHVLVDDLPTGNIIQGLSGFNQKALEEFKRQGYLVIHDAFDAKTVDALLDTLEDLMEKRNPGFKRDCKKTRETNPDLALGGGEPVLQYEPEAANVERSKRSKFIRKLQNFHRYDDRFNLVLESPEFMGIVQQLIGDTTDNKVEDGQTVLQRLGLEVFQSLALLKPPQVGREKPWHQDHAYFNLPVDAPLVGMWMALDHAKPSNGCMHVLPGNVGPITHFKRRDWQICDSEILGNKAVAIPLKPGSLMLFTSFIPHGTPPNNSDDSRRAVQFHFCRLGQPRLTTEDRMRTFGSDGRNVSC